MGQKVNLITLLCSLLLSALVSPAMAQPKNMLPAFTACTRRQTATGRDPTVLECGLIPFMQHDYANELTCMPSAATGARRMRSIKVPALRLCCEQGKPALLGHGRADATLREASHASRHYPGHTAPLSSPLHLRLALFLTAG